ncbi:MAG: amidase [Alphaproteobacteria bacterium]|nr:amidase [Alphaproteobacteria bacterium]
MHKPGKFNAFTDESLALDGAKSGPLAGTTFAVKDLFDIAGTVAACGNPDWARTHSAAKAHAEAVSTLLAAGASVRGKTITDEFAFSIIGENHHYGTPINPNALGHVCGGSSSGSAAAVAGNLVDFALGTDTGGSVRIPSSFCGIFGLRPSHGRVSLKGVFPLAASFDTVGWFARDPVLMQKIGQVLLQNPIAASKSPSRLLYPVDVWQDVASDTALALDPGVSRLEELYGPVERMTLAEGSNLAEWFETFRVAQGAEIWQTLGAWIEDVQPSIGPGIKERLDWCKSLTKAMQDDALSRREEIASRLQDVTQDGSVLVLPAAPGPAIESGRSAVASNEIRAQIIRLSGIAPLSGVPQMSLPVAKVTGLPVALSLMAARGSDEILLKMATELCGTAVDGLAPLL